MRKLQCSSVGAYPTRVCRALNGLILRLHHKHAGHEVVGVDGVEAAAWQLQRDSWLKFEVTHREPSSVGGNRPSFIPAPTFQKRRSGYVFKTDSMGTGYYIDAKAIKVIFTEPAGI